MYTAILRKRSDFARSQMNGLQRKQNLHHSECSRRNCLSFFNNVNVIQLVVAGTITNATSTQQRIEIENRTEQNRTKTVATLSEPRAL